MEKMLSKKARDFATEMQDTMVYDKSKNEVQIGTNLYVDGYIKTAGNKRIIKVSGLPVDSEGTNVIFDATNFPGVTVLTYQEEVKDKTLKINTGNSYIIIDENFKTNGVITGLQALPLANGNFADIDIAMMSSTDIIVINLSSVVLIYGDNQI